ncbi:MAG: HAMP domain-containing sensor histidine kinase [Marinobacter sp.]|uniref:sensor histidine kinase n=1 Tax=Marinobacter sp. TaxID=50741 RepID=UPI00299E40C5|nr:HAMP domain-containing sensor histidine kinase [Marinobacter sp.]MDX1756311.1 HAMP domain-containing sensor histidine kinase [Marinobacter sp.]
MQVPWYSSIRTRVLVLVVAPLILLFSLLVFNSKHVSDQILVENLTHSVTTYSQTLNLGISVHLGTGNSVAQIAPFLNEFIGSNGDGIVYLALTNEQGELLAKTPRSPELSSVVANRPITPTVLSQAQYHVATPILLDRDNVGVLHYGVSLESIRQATQQVFGDYLELSLLGLGVIVALIVGVSIWMLLRMNRRVNDLLERSRRIAKGEYDVPIAIKGRDEIGVLNWQMERMREAIRTRILELNDSRKQVETLNEDLLQTLEQLKVSQQSLVQSEKLASLGSIVAAVAHELNTPVGNALTVATTFDHKSREFAQAMDQGLRKSTLEKYVSDAHQATELIARNLTRASDLVESFKHVAVDQTSSKRRRFNLSDTVADLLATLRPTIKHRPITTYVDIPQGIEMDSFPGPLCQVISNLFNNSMLHAFEPEDKGTWRITAHLNDEEQVILRVSDDGKGISRPVLGKIFDPFYTTRLGRGGSGLGLHIVYNISTAILGGTVSVSSEPGQGTTFILRLPLCPESQAENSSDKSVTA